MAQKPWILLWGRNAKMQIYQHFGINTVPPSCNIIKNETQAQVVFVRILWVFTVGIFIKSQTL